MHKLDIEISFNIDDWKVNSPRVSTHEQWKTWFRNGHKESEQPPFKASLVPPMMRRRMSSLSKVAVQTAFELLEMHQVDYMVFSSRHGELHRSIKLVEDIINGEEASPMAFSQSVHNTAAGLATIATKKKLPTTSISAGNNTFHSAIIEAYSYLIVNPEHKVLILDFDEPVPAPYQEFEEENYPLYGLG